MIYSSRSKINNANETSKNTRFRNATYGSSDCYTIADRNTIPEPNTSYIDSLGNRYRTDGLGRTVIAEGELQREPATQRNGTAQKNTPGKLMDDQAGHLLGHQSGGLDSRVNLTAQNGNLNQGEYKSMELRAQKEMESGNRVYRSVQPLYEGDSVRPSRYQVTDTIMDPDGNPIRSHNYSFANADAETREELYDYDNSESEPSEDLRAHEERQADLEEAFGQSEEDTENTEQTEEPGGTESREQTENPGDTENREQTENPEDAENNEQTEEPEDAENNEQTEEPEDAENSEQTEEPEDAENSEQTEEPEDTENSEQTEEPEDTENSEQTEEPEDTENSEQTEEPEDTENSEQTEEPGDTENSEQAGEAEDMDYYNGIG